MLSQPSALPEGTRIDNYRIERRLGKGGFGITYLATELAEIKGGDTREVRLREVAIKEYFPQGVAVRTHGHTVSPNADMDGAGDAMKSGLRAFLKEAQAIASLEHESIVRIYRVFEWEPMRTAYFVMPYLQGESLRAVIRRGRPGESRLLGLLLPVMDALEHAHTRGLLHRDLKPDNIMVRERDGRPVLIDFGTSRAETANDAQQYTRLTDLVAYTPGYAALEQYARASSDNRHDLRTDLYGLAATFYEALTGRVPAESVARAAEVHGGRPDPLITASSLLADEGSYGRALLAAIDWGLELSARDRPASVAEMREAVMGRRQPTGATLARLEAAGVSIEPYTAVNWSAAATATAPAAGPATRPTNGSAAGPATVASAESGVVARVPTQAPATAAAVTAPVTTRSPPMTVVSLRAQAAPDGSVRKYFKDDGRVEGSEAAVLGQTRSDAQRRAVAGGGRMFWIGWAVVGLIGLGLALTESQTRLVAGVVAKLKMVDERR